MKYRTTIEIVSDAKDKHEALEIVGEYLLGNIMSGIDMRCKTRPIKIYRAIVASVAIVGLAVSIGLFTLLPVKGSHNFPVAQSRIDAVPAPLKTSPMTTEDIEFKKRWNEKQVKAAFETILKK